MPKAIINGNAIHYEQMGQGQDLVMIHGLFSNLAFWYLSVMPILARSLRVTAYDLRGHGYSNMPLQGYTSRDLAEDLNELLSQLRIEQAHIVGHSFGGAVALSLACTYPARVQSLILADAWVPGLQPPLPPRSAPHWGILRAQLKRDGFDLPEDMPRIVYSYFEELARLRRIKNEEKNDPLPTALLADRWDDNSRSARNWLRLIRNTSAITDMNNDAGLTVQQLRQIQQPALAVFGQYSYCLPTLRGIQKAMPHCQTVIVSRAGHFHPLLRQKLFIELLNQFIFQRIPLSGKG